ncbi:MAG TPA: hypothetical protein VGD64_09755 [Acidisarcina sp.]
MEILQQLVLKLNVFGIGVEVHSEDETALANLRADFAHFESEAITPGLKVSLLFQPPPYDSVPPTEASVYTPRNISFHNGKVTYIDYSGRALAIFDDTLKSIRIFSTDRDLLYEAAYLFLLSQLGESLDQRGMHRVHALGFSVKGKAALVLLPMGGGKSTLGTHLLQHPSVKILSDDSPLVDREGRLWCFPLRIGLLPGSEGDIQPEDLRCIQRMEFGPKLLLRHEYFEHRIVESAPASFIFIGRRSLGEHCRIVPVSRFAALRQLVPNCIVGMGLFQGMEFMFNRSAGAVAAKLSMAFSRSRNCWVLCGKASAQKLILGRNHKVNAETLIAFMERDDNASDAVSG